MSHYKGEAEDAMETRNVECQNHGTSAEESP
jgi:hypothetical protein